LKTIFHLTGKGMPETFIPLPELILA
jgi:hypothetical protein